jgi:hypothetical protein
MWSSSYGSPVGDAGNLNPMNILTSNELAGGSLARRHTMNICFCRTTCSVVVVLCTGHVWKAELVIKVVIMLALLNYSPYL